MTKLRAILRRRWPVLAVCLLLGMVAGVASMAISPKRETTQYKAEQVIVANRLAGNPANVLTQTENAVILREPNWGAPL